MSIDILTHIEAMVKTILSWDNQYQRDRWLKKILPRELDRIIRMLDDIGRGLPIHTRPRGKKLRCGLCLDWKAKDNVLTVVKNKDGLFHLVSSTYDNLRFRDAYWVCGPCWEKLDSV